MFIVDTLRLFLHRKLKHKLMGQQKNKDHHSQDYGDQRNRTNYHYYYFVVKLFIVVVIIVIVVVAIIIVIIHHCCCTVFYIEYSLY